MRYLIENFRRAYYRDELKTLKTLVFVSRLGPENASVTLSDWRRWAETFGININDFEQCRHELEYRGYVTGYRGLYRTTDEGAKWYKRLAKKSLVLY